MTDATPDGPNAAHSYETLLVPALMKTWAPRVADAARIGPGDRVLDVACGTGVLTREVMHRVGPAGTVTGLDLDPGMLAVAAELRPGVSWRQGSAEALPFEDAAFDAVVSQFGLMFVLDRVQALREMTRVLRPGGRLAVAVWASLDVTPVYAAEVALVERLGGPAAADGLRSPFTLGDPAVLVELARQAGISGPHVAVQAGRGQFRSIRELVEADIVGWLPLLGVSLAPDIVDAILRDAETELVPFLTRTPDGVEFASPAVLLTATMSA